MTRQHATGYAEAGSFRLREWLVEPRLNRLTRDGESFQIELKMMDVLVCLAEHAGELVERQQLIDTVWATEYITEKTLTRAVAELRRTLGDDAKQPTYIETIHRKGYRLIAPVEPVEPQQATVTPFPTPAASRDDRSPYPGLAAFTEEDAEFFFGREAEVAALWRKITSRRLLAVIGPSGVGKSSFLRAGVIPAAPEGWGILYCQPGEDPFAELGRTVAAEFSDDPEALGKLVTFRDNAPHLFSRWRGRHERVLLVVDQFEELVTLNPSAVQQAFSSLLGQLARSSDIHVLLSMRDDFLYRCHAVESLQPILEDLTALKQPDREALHRAIVEPARALGYRFEHDDLPNEMVAEVADERAALPLLAFAIARLWEKRDRRSKLLTRQAYDDIGGVAGALARQAEATVDTVGHEGLPIVRELFRNLVTAEGTRAVREWDELISIFRDSRSESQAEEVLRQLVDSRLLTSYEVREADEAPTRRIEIVHESLLANWPRLVRWKTQDDDAAQLRDQLRQAAKTWGEHGRTDDMLWTGSAYREFSVWRETYPGGLSDTEAAFADAMSANANRRRRRRQLAVALFIATLLVVLGIVATSRQKAVTEANRAEASKMIVFGQHELDSNPTLALAWARASLGVADTLAGRDLAASALSRGGTARLLVLDQETEGVVHEMSFSPDGEWAALVSYNTLNVARSSGGPMVFTDRFPGDLHIWDLFAWFGASNQRLLTWKQISDHGTAVVRHYEVPSFDVIADITYQPTEPEPPGTSLWGTRQGTFIATPKRGEIVIDRIDIDGSVGTVERLERSDRVFLTKNGEWLVRRDGRKTFIRRFGATSHEERLLLEVDRDVGQVGVDAGLEWFFGRAPNNEEICLWKLSTGSPEPFRCLDNRENNWFHVARDPQGHRVALAGVVDGTGTVNVWDLRLPPDSLPLTFRYPATWLNGLTFDSSGRWIVASMVMYAAFWPLPDVTPYRIGMPSAADSSWVVGFTPDGESLITSDAQAITIRPLVAGGIDRAVSPGLQPLYRWGHYLDPNGEFLMGSNFDQRSVELVPLDGSPRSVIQDLSDWPPRMSVAYHPGRQLLASAPGLSTRDQKVIHVRNLDTGVETVLGPPEEAGDEFDGVYWTLEFLPDGDLLSCGNGGIRRWNVENGSSERLYSEGCSDMKPVPDASSVIFIPRNNIVSEHPVLLDLETREMHRFENWIDDPTRLAVTADGKMFATGSRSGVIQIGSVSGPEQHRLYGHNRATAVWFSGDGRQLASMGRDGFVRVWPVPDLSRPSLDALPLAELLAKLDTLTNHNIVRDEESPNGWAEETGPFPGWAELPEW